MEHSDVSYCQSYDRNRTQTVTLKINTERKVSFQITPTKTLTTRDREFAKVFRAGHNLKLDVLLDQAYDYFKILGVSGINPEQYESCLNTLINELPDADGGVARECVLSDDTSISISIVQESGVIVHSVENEMSSSYLDYSMSVIVGRALPDIRDGLKPIHRRVVYAMHELNSMFNTPYKKSARIVGEVIGKYHCHGDTSIYDTAVRLAQPFSMRYPLIDGQGNFGSIDGDSPAAMRYTEMRLERVSNAVVDELAFNTVDMRPNFDGTEQEPTVLPTKVPLLLVNGSSGIAVGMATNIPPHNLNNVCDAVIELLNQDIENILKDTNDEVSLDTLIDLLEGPDFPTGAKILGTRAIRDMYLYGKGGIVMCSVWHTEPRSSSKDNIVITELPYQVNKAKLIGRIADLVKEKRIEGISNIRDESDKDGIRVVVELKRDFNADVVFNNLAKLTDVKTKFSANIVALVNGRPKRLTLVEILKEFIRHRHEVVARKFEFKRDTLAKELEVINAKIVTHENIESIVDLLVSSKTVDDSKDRLFNDLDFSIPECMVESMLPEEYLRYDQLVDAGRVYFTERQVDTVLGISLRQLPHMEFGKLTNRRNEIIADLTSIYKLLSDPVRFNHYLIHELEEVVHQHGDERRTEIIPQEDESVDDIEFIQNTQQIITRTRDGWVKRMSLEQYREQVRGGKGLSCGKLKDEDVVIDLLSTTTHSHLFYFTNMGRVYRNCCYQIPESSRGSKGTPLVNVISLMDGEEVCKIISVEDLQSDADVIFAVSNGKIKRTPLSEYSNVMSSGKKAIRLIDDSYIVDVGLATGTSNDVMLFTDNGQVAVFNLDLVRRQSRQGMGIKGITLRNRNRLVGMVLSGNCESVLTVTRLGQGKLSKLSEYKVKGRGGLGYKALTLNRNDSVVSAIGVNSTDSMLIATAKGVLIRTPLAPITPVGRVSKGIILINLKDKDTKEYIDEVVSIKVVKELTDGVSDSID